MDTRAVAPRPTTYTFGQYGAGFSPLRDCLNQDADGAFPSPPPSRSPPSSPPSRGDSRSPCPPNASLASGLLLPRHRRKRPRSWSTTGTNDDFISHHPPLSPVTTAACDNSTSPLKRGDSSTSECGEDDNVWRGGRRPLKTAGADDTAPRENGKARGRRRRVGEWGVSHVEREDDDAAAGTDEHRAREEGEEAVVDDDGSFGEATWCSEAEGTGAADSGGGGQRRARGEESGQPRPRYHEGGENGIATRSARQQQQQQQQIVRVVVHEVLSEDFGLFTWPSGVLLAYLIWARRREFRGVSVVEIGAGTALPGLLAAKLGARVLLTDRDGAPWVLENMRGAVAANGLLAASDDDGNGEENVGASVGNRPHDMNASSVDVTAPRAGDEGGDAEGSEVGGSDGGGRGWAKGSCSVRSLSWGKVGPAMIELAREQWRPQVVLGADVFYSSEHFDSVLATAFMLLSATACASGGGGGGCGGVGADVDIATDAPSVPRGVGDGTGGAGADASLSSAADVTVTAAEAGASTEDGESPPAAAAAAARTPPASSPKPTTNVADNIASSSSSSSSSSSYGSPFSRDKGVFLTAYHERSARRSLRPLLRKWGMEARVLHNAPRKVLPPGLWQSGRYDSVALLEITLMG